MNCLTSVQSSFNHHSTINIYCWRLGSLILYVQYSRLDNDTD